MQLMIGTKAKPVLLSFPTLFEAKQISQDSTAKKFSTQILFHKEHDKDIIEQVKKAITEATIEGVNKGKIKAAQVKLPKFRNCLRCGDAYADEGVAEGKDREYARGYMFISATANEDSPPVVTDRFNKPINNAAEIYGGVKAIAVVNFYAYDVKGNTGIAAGLNGIMKREDGERFDGRMSANAFNSLADNEDDEAITNYGQGLAANEGAESGDLQ